MNIIQLDKEPVIFPYFLLYLYLIFIEVIPARF